MNIGNQVFDNEYKRKVQGILDKNQDKSFLKGFINFIADKSYSTIWLYTSYVVQFMNTVKKSPDLLELGDFTYYMSEIKNKTSSYQISVYSALKEFSYYLKASNINPNDYMQYKKRPSHKESVETVQKREIGFLEKDEIKDYISQVYEGSGTDRAKARQREWMTRDACIIIFLLNTGMRCAALWKLDIDNIDFQNNKLVTVDKGGKIQEYFLSDKMISALKDWLEQRKVILNESTEKALFISNRRTRMTQLSIANIVNKYAINIKGKHITPHKLRATAITTVYEDTGDVYMAQQFAGHASPTLTANRYIRGKKDIARQTGADIMNSII